MALDITTLASTDKLSDSRGDINTNFTNIATDLDALSDDLENLTDGEVTQLEAIGATTISAAQWAYLGDLDQALKKASSITFADLTLSGLTASELTATDASKKLQSLAVATYPSLTEISYIKGLSSAIQGQIDGKAASLGEDDNYVTDADITLLGNTSGENTGDQDLSGKANVDQTMYIGTTAVNINRGTAALTLAGITLTTPDIGTPSAGTLTNCTFPTLNQNTTGTAANLSGTPNLSIGTLGCGAITSTGDLTVGNSTTPKSIKNTAFYVSDFADHASELLHAETWGILMVSEDSSEEAAIFLLEYNSLVIVSDTHSHYSITKDNDTTINVYYDTDGFYIQNELGASKIIRAILIRNL